MKASVTVEEINHQRELGWPDFHPEDYCHRCGGRNLSWAVDSDRFNIAFGTSHPYNGIVCPGCFAEAHQAATSLSTTWLLAPYPGIPQRMAPYPSPPQRPTTPPRAVDQEPT